MNYILSLVLKIVAAMATISGLLQGFVALKEITKDHMPPGRKKKKLFILLWFLVAFFCFYGANSPSLPPLFPDSSPTVISTQTPAILVTSTSSSPIPTATSTPIPETTPTSTNYSAPHPGSGCDTGGGTWTMQGFSTPFTCDTELSVTSSNARAYLFFHLPKDEAFSPNNRIGITGTFVYMGQYCFGLVEQDAKAGYLGEYCNNGEWFIYSISSAGAIIGTLKQGISPGPGVNVQFSKAIALTLQGATLTFSIGSSEMYNVTISPIQPVSVAITYLAKDVGRTPGSMTVNNFGYTVVSS